MKIIKLSVVRDFYYLIFSNFYQSYYIYNIMKVVHSSTALKRISHKLLQIWLNMTFALCFQQVIQSSCHFMWTHIFNSFIKFLRAVNNKFLVVDCLNSFSELLPCCLLKILGQMRFSWGELKRNRNISKKPIINISSHFSDILKVKSPFTTLTPTAPWLKQVFPGKPVDSQMNTQDSLRFISWATVSKPFL